MLSDDVAIHVSGLTQRFGGVQALDGVDVRVRRGEFVCVVGPSGCGKTTLLRILAGLNMPTGGTARVVGKTAVVFQGQSLFPWLTALDNVAYGLQLEGVPAAARRAAALAQLRHVGLERFARAYPTTLSGGMQQRVNLARALAVQPAVLLMDEPFGSLDEQTRLTMQAQLAALWEQSGTTVVFITHSVEEAVALSDRVLVMSARPGRVILDLPVEVPRPRVRYEERNTPTFRAAANAVWHALEGELTSSEFQVPSSRMPT